VSSFTDPAENVFEYGGWWLTGENREPRSVKVLEWRPHSKGWVVRLDGVTDRTAAEQLAGMDIQVAVSELPELPEGEYYWYQLEGLSVRDTGGRELGRVVRLMETGANDVLVVRAEKAQSWGRECLIPWLPEQVVQSVDLDAGQMVVNWDPDY
jgi:16S rRNA processing protein RimM